MCECGFSDYLMDSRAVACAWGSWRVSVYRIYILDAAGRIGAPPHVIECDDDNQAIRQARQYVGGRVTEVWRDITLIGRFESAPLRE
jgi:hypothetical protein